MYFVDRNMTLDRALSVMNHKLERALDGERIESNELYDAMGAVLRHFIEKEEEPETTFQYEIRGGPQHGGTIELMCAPTDGEIVNQFVPGVFYKANPDTPVRYGPGQLFKRSYQIFRGVAYYMGEELSVSPIVEEAEQLAGRIS